MRCISWFPSMLTSMGLSAADSGLLFGLMQLVSVPAGMVILAIGSRPRMLRPALYLVSIIMVAGLASLLFLPVSLAVIPAVLLGFGLGIFPLVMVMISRSGTEHRRDHGPVHPGAVHRLPLGHGGPVRHRPAARLTGSWTLPVALLLGLAVVQVVVAHLISRSPNRAAEKK